MDNDDRQVNMPEDMPERAAEQQEESVSRKRRPRHLGLLALILVGVLAVTALTTMEDGRHFAALRRWLMYGEDSRSENVYFYTPDKANQWGILGEQLLIVSPNGVQLAQNNGTAVYQLPIAVKNPSLSVGKTLAAVCDVGGEVVYILDEVGLKTTLTTEGEHGFYTARFNGQDILTVTEQKSGYKTAVTAYDKDMKPLFHFDSHDGYISDAVVTEDGKYLIAVRMDVEDGTFGSRILVYDMTTAEKISETLIHDGMVMDIRAAGDKILSLCDKRLTITELDGTENLNKSYGSLYLHNYALGGKNFCALMLGRYQSGNICTLTTFDFSGQELASLDLTEEVLDMSAAGDNLAVLFSNSLVIYDRELHERSRMEDTDFSGHVQMYPDGTALVIGGTAARRYLP